MWLRSTPFYEVSMPVPSNVSHRNGQKSPSAHTLQSWFMHCKLPLLYPALRFHCGQYFSISAHRPPVPTPIVSPHHQPDDYVNLCTLHRALKPGASSRGTLHNRRCRSGCAGKQAEHALLINLSRIISKHKAAINILAQEASALGRELVF